MNLFPFFAFWRRVANEDVFEDHFGIRDKFLLDIIEGYDVVSCLLFLRSLLLAQNFWLHSSFWMEKVFAFVKLLLEKNISRHFINGILIDLV
jgi:hypothetical protein